MYRYLLATAFLVIAIDSSPAFPFRHPRDENTSNKPSLIRTEETRLPRQIPRQSFNFDLSSFEPVSTSDESTDWYEDNDDDEEEDKLVVPKPLRILGVLRNKASSGSGTSNDNEADHVVKEVPTNEDTFIPEMVKKNPSLTFPTNYRDLFNRRFQSQIRNGAGSQQSSDHYAGAHVREMKSSGPTLSIVGPLEVLRQSKLWEKARRRHQAKEEILRHNERILADKGKRSVPDYY